MQAGCSAGFAGIQLTGWKFSDVSIAVLSSSLAQAEEAWPSWLTTVEERSLNPSRLLSTKLP